MCALDIFTARELRSIQCPGGRYHITAGGNERREIFWDDTDRFHFLELLSELCKRFGTRVHAYVLMDRTVVAQAVPAVHHNRPPKYKTNGPRANVIPSDQP